MQVDEVGDESISRKDVARFGGLKLRVLFHSGLVGMKDDVWEAM